MCTVISLPRMWALRGQKLSSVWFITLCLVPTTVPGTYAALNKYLLNECANRRVWQGRNTLPSSHLFWFDPQWNDKREGPPEGRVNRESFLRHFKGLAGSNPSEGLKEAWNQRLCLQGEQVRGLRWPWWERPLKVKMTSSLVTRTTVVTPLSQAE